MLARAAYDRPFQCLGPVVAGALVVSVHAAAVVVDEIASPVAWCGVFMCIHFSPFHFATSYGNIIRYYICASVNNIICINCTASARACVRDNRHPYADQHREKVAIYRKGPARRPAQIWCVSCGAISTDPKCRSPRVPLRDPVPLPCSGRGQQPIRAMRAAAVRSSGIQRSILGRLPSMGASSFLSWPVSSVAGGQSLPDARRRFD